MIDSGISWLSFYNLILYDPVSVLVTTAFSLTVAFSLSVALFKIGLFGGADAKALIIMSWFIPTMIPLLSSSRFSLLTSLATTVNFVVYLTLIFCMNFARNFYSQLIGDRGLLASPISKLKRFSVLCAFRKLPSSAQTHADVSHLFSANSNVPSSLVIIEDTKRAIFWTRDRGLRDIPSRFLIAEAWIPLRIPATLLLTVSLLTSLLTGDLLSLIAR